MTLKTNPRIIIIKYIQKYMNKMLNYNPTGLENTYFMKWSYRISNMPLNT